MRFLGFACGEEMSIKKVFIFNPQADVIFYQTYHWEKTLQKDDFYGKALWKIL